LGMRHERQTRQEGQDEGNNEFEFQGEAWLCG
jgi:hypothetical protein